MAVLQADYDSLSRAFEDQRRQRLLGLLIPIGIILTALAIIGGAVALITGTAQPGMNITVSLSVLLVAALSGSAYALRRGQVALATIVFLASTILTILGLVTVLCVATPFSDQSLVQLACLSIILSLASAISDARGIVLAAALESVVITLVLLLVPSQGILAGANGMTQHRIILIIGVLTYHWAIAALLIAVASTLRRTLSTLGQTTSQLTQAQQVDELKDQFITQVNHELRTPIMSLQGYVDLISELDDDLTPEDRKLMLAKAQTAGENLIRFVNDVLDTRRVDQDTAFEPVCTPIRPAVAEALAAIPPQEHRPLHIDITNGLAVWGDPARLRQVLTNLISNAVKYSPPGSPIVVTAGEIGDKVELVVRDYGLGIPPEQAAALFHRFVRLERDLRSSVRGTGVGLYLCRTYVEAMGGDIRVESTGIPGDGSRFIIHLPVFTGTFDTPELTPTRKLERRRS